MKTQYACNGSAYRCCKMECIRKCLQLIFLESANALKLQNALKLRKSPYVVCVFYNINVIRHMLCTTYYTFYIVYYIFYIIYYMFCPLRALVCCPSFVPGFAYVYIITIIIIFIIIAPPQET